nr:MAG: hypothetical protein DIU75_23470 [Mycolicibacterium hassiacum]
MITVGTGVAVLLVIGLVAGFLWLKGDDDAGRPCSMPATGHSQASARVRPRSDHPRRRGAGPQQAGVHKPGDQPAPGAVHDRGSPPRLRGGLGGRAAPGQLPAQGAGHPRFRRAHRKAGLHRPRLDRDVPAGDHHHAAPRVAAAVATDYGGRRRAGYAVAR